MLDPDGVARLLERQIVEVAPLAFMRGRTLNDSFIILDEAQNTTPEQMKMFLTRIGFNSRVVVTGDTTQVDVANGKSGLAGLERTLTGIDGLAFVKLTGADVVRHKIVADIVAAYEKQPPTTHVTSPRSARCRRVRRRARRQDIAALPVDVDRWGALAEAVLRRRGRRAANSRSRSSTTPTSPSSTPSTWARTGRPTCCRSRSTTAMIRSPVCRPCSATS